MFNRMTRPPRTKFDVNPRPSGHDSFPLIARTSVVPSVSSPSSESTHRSQVDLDARLENTLRQWGLQIVYISIHSIGKLAHHSRRAQGRIAIFQDRYTAVLSAASSIPAMIAPIVLSIFIFQDYYIGGELAGPSGYDVEKFFALQVTAKLLELLITWSLSSMIFTLVHRNIIKGQGIPLASLVAGFQFTSISFLLSKEFWAIVKGQFSTIRKKIIFIVLVVLCTFLALAAAPSAAAVINPVPDWWPAGGTDVWLNTTQAEIFPAVLNNTYTLGRVCAISGNQYCPSAKWQSINENFVSLLSTSSQIVDGVIRTRAPSEIHVVGKNSLVAIQIDVREPYFDAFSPNFSVATAPHFAIADAIILGHVHWDIATRESTQHGEKRFYYRSGEKVQLFGPAAITHTKCRLSTRPADSSDPLSFPDFYYDDFREVNITSEDLQNWISKTLPRISSPEILWFGPRPDTAANTSLGALVALPTNSTSMVQLYGCFIDARWVDTRLNGDRSTLIASGTPVGFRPITMDGNARGIWLKDPHYGSRVRIEPSFAQYLNPRIPSTNSTVLQEMASSGGLWEPGATGESSESHLEAILNVMIINGIIRTAPYTTVLAHIADASGPWWRNFMPQGKKTFGPGGNGYLVTSEQQARSYRLHMEALAQGYAYKSDNRAIRASLTTLYLYVAVATTFIILIVATGVTSSSWDTPLELLTLALRSSPPPSEKLPDASAGSFEIRPISEQYCVVSDGNGLQLQPVEGQVPREKIVQTNTRYR